MSIVSDALGAAISAISTVTSSETLEYSTDRSTWTALPTSCLWREKSVEPEYDDEHGKEVNRQIATLTAPASVTVLAESIFIRVNADAARIWVIKSKTGDDSSFFSYECNLITTTKYGRDRGRIS